jgi:acetylornithine deacetylase
MIADHEQAILDSCDAVFDDAIAFTRDMVGQYAVLNQEQGVLEVVERQLRALDLPVARVGIDAERLAANPLFAPVDWGYDNKYNLVSALNPGADGRRLVFNGHLDVVPATPVDMWSRPPSECWERDGWLYGRGSGDMQSGVAAMVYAVHAVRRAGFRIDSPLTLQAVVEEECTGNGALACLDAGYDGDFVLIPEPFGPQIYAGQIGVLWFRITCRGRPAHVLDTSAGSNAIERLQRVIPHLKSLEDELNTRHRAPPYDSFAHPFNLNIGTISGGNWASSVPAHAQLEGRIGFPPGMTANEIMQRVSDAVQAAVAADPELGAERPLLRFPGFRSEGHLVNLGDPGIELLSQCHFSLLGEEPAAMYSTATTDLRAFHFYRRMGGTCYGPVAQRIHGIDECVSLDSVRHTLRSYALFIARWCHISRL